jgi:hypothetical protein
MGVQPIVVPQSLAYVLNSAGDKSDVDFNFLLQTAVRESSLNPQAKAPSSSAVGLFQFLDGTWLQVMKEEGPRLGYQKYADAITVDRNGDYTIKDKALRAEVLKLRENPQVAADMAAAFTRSNGDYLQSKFGRMPSPGELYIAHFLGPKGAERLFAAGLQNPDQIAAKLFPRQAQANPRIFYADGHARTIREVYKSLVARHDGIVSADVQPDAKFAAQQLAATPASRWATDNVPSRFSRDDMSFTSMFNTDTRSPVPQPLIAVAGNGPLIPTTGEQPLALMPTSSPVPLAAIDAALGASHGVDNPLPAPLPLMPDGAPLSYAPPVTTNGEPAARVLLSPRSAGDPTSAFFAQLYSQR